MATFGSPKRIPGLEVYDASPPHIAAAGKNFYVLWHEPNRTLVSTPTSEIYISRSTDGGKTFSPPINLSNSTKDSSDEAIAARGDTVYVAWVEPSPEGPEIFFRRSTDNGKSFDQKKSLAREVPGGGVVLPPPTIAVSESNVYVMWMTIPTIAGYDDVFVAHSKDSGKTFGKGINVSYDVNVSKDDARDPQVAASGDAVIVTWRSATNPTGKPDQQNMEVFVVRGQ